MRFENIYLRDPGQKAGTIFLRAATTSGHINIIYASAFLNIF